MLAGVVGHAERIVDDIEECDMIPSSGEFFQ
jgi:hypothetical protein